MDQNVVKQYQVSFTNKIFDFKIKGKEIIKVPTVNNIHLNNFLIETNVERINDDLLTDIEAGLLNLNSEISNGSESVSILIYHDRTELYDDDGFVYELPTQDFKEIVIGWRDFLLTPPLNGSKV